MHAGLHALNTHVLNTFHFSLSVMFLLFQIVPMALTTAFPLVIRNLISFEQDQS